MKILHIQVLPKLSGVQKISLEILKNLDPEISKYVVFSDDSVIGNKEKCINEFKKIGVNIIFLKSLKRNIGLWDLKAFWDIYKLCKKEKFDIVHTHSTKPGVIGRIAAKLAGTKKVLHTVHGISFHKFETPIRRIFYYICEIFSSFFCNNIILVNEYYKKYFIIFKNKVTTIYNGINFDEFYYKNITNKDNLINILYVGRLDFQKNPLLLLRIFKKVLERRNNIKLTIVGDGDLMDECIKFINNNNLSESIKLEKWQDNIDKFYLNSDIFFNTSRYEAFGLTLCEASFFNLPIVSTNVEGIPEVVINNETGLLSSVEDEEKIINDLIYLIDNKDIREIMGKKAHEYVLNKFSSKEMITKYFKIYNLIR